MKKFKTKTLILWVLIPQLVIYLIWAFTVLSLAEPIIQTFTTPHGRFIYIFFIANSIVMGTPYYEIDKK